MMKRHRVPTLSRLLYPLTALVLFGRCAPSARPLPVLEVMPPRPDIIYPAITPVTNAPDAAPFSHTFRFEGDSYGMTIRLDADALAGARQAEKSVEMTKPHDPSLWRAGLQWALISDPAQGPLMDRLTGFLDGIRREQALDEDRYAELIANFVQSIPYCSAPGQPPKYPIETLGDGCGDCDDKSRLLAALLHREGYGTALFFYIEEKHMTVGVRTDDRGFRGTGYAYIETTAPSYIGFPPSEHATVALSSDPTVIRLDDNPRMWRQGDQVRFLYQTLERERGRAEGLRSALAPSQRRIERLKRERAELVARLEEGEGALSTSAYNGLVNDVNRAGDRLNRHIDDHNALAREVNQSAAIVNHILAHPDDRHGVHRWVLERTSE